MSPEERVKAYKAVSMRVAEHALKSVETATNKSVEDGEPFVVPAESLDVMLMVCDLAWFGFEHLKETSDGAP